MALLSASTLAAGVGIGAAIGPAPAPSLAGSASVISSLPALVASLAARRATQAHTSAAASAGTGEVAATPRRRRHKRRRASAAPASSTAPTTQSTSASEPATSGAETTKPAGKHTAASKLPPVTSVWLIELAGTSFAEAQATPSAAPYITSQLIGKGTLLSGWSALEASAFASDAVLAEHRPTLGATPPVEHTLVQPACAEGAPCGSGAGALAAADEFAKAAVASITQSTSYSEHGLIVVTFASVAGAAAAELPAGSSAASLATQPAAGVLLVSPFVKAGASSSAAFNPTSPKQALEALLHG